MQSSAAVAGRALFMLACVVGIPALAISGRSWSEMLKRVQDFRWPAIPSAAAATSRNPTGLSEATPPREFSPAAAATPAWPSQAVEPANSGVVPVDYQVPTESRAGGWPTTVPIAENSAGGVPAGADPFLWIQGRLQELGATYYLLESWGNQQQMYRFYCRMAVGGNANYTHYFEATESEPLQAMLQVLRQVETWRQGGTLAVGGSR
jgi:hypothetical protein